MSTGPLWREAAAFAARAHRHQVRKDGVTPYAAHTTRVAMTIACVFGVTEETVLAAALLHDAIEDTTADFDEIEGQFGRDVAELVAAMSKDMRLPERQREAAYDAQLAQAPWQARLIKLADVQDNYLDALGRSEQARAKIAEKVARALALAEGQPELEHAAKIVSGLIRGEADHG